MTMYCEVRGCLSLRKCLDSRYCEEHSPTQETTKVSAPQILTTAAQHMQERAATYDQPQGERSMGKTVAMFNALTGNTLTDEQGWLFMACLKMVRTQQGGYRADSYEDGAAYFALAGESAAQERKR
jgi:hypothetical protein